MSPLTPHSAPPFALAQAEGGRIALYNAVGEVIAEVYPLGTGRKAEQHANARLFVAAPVLGAWLCPCPAASKASACTLLASPGEVAAYLTGHAPHLPDLRHRYELVDQTTGRIWASARLYAGEVVLRNADLRAAPVPRLWLRSVTPRLDALSEALKRESDETTDRPTTATNNPDD